MRSRPILTLAAALAAQSVVIGLAVLPQLSARTRGDEYLLRVEPVDPIDPFRGAYVALGYPDLNLSQIEDAAAEDPGGTVFVTLAERNGVWVAVGQDSERPSAGPYLACDNHTWRLRCGIESYFLPQDRATEVEQSVADGDVVATIKIDDRGNAAIVDLE